MNRVSFTTQSKKILSVIIALFLLHSGKATAQWAQIQGLYGEPVYKVRANGTKIFALSGGGGIMSATSGASWNIVPSLYLTNIIDNLSVSVNNVVAYASPDSYLSTDNGVTWSTIQNGPAGTNPSDMIVSNGTLILATYGNYIYTSPASAVSWTQSTTGLTTPNINCIWTDGTTLVAGTDDGVFKSTDGGLTFSAAGLQGNDIYKIYTKNAYIFTFGSNGVNQSSDGGVTWINFNPQIPYSDITEFFISSAKVFATTSGELLVSSVSAPTWSYVNYGTEVKFNFSICRSGTDLFTGTNRGIMHSTDNGVSWNEFNTGLYPNNVSSLSIVNTDTLYAGASIYGVSRNILSGTGWQFSGLGLLNSSSMTSRLNEIYSACDLGIQRSTDGGQSWQLINNVGANPVITYCADVAVKDTLIIGAAISSGILRSGDNGASWSLIGNGFNGQSVSSVEICGSKLIAGTYGDGLYTSTDGGFSWIQTAASSDQINDITVSGNTVLAAGNAGLWRSNDGGSTWSNAAATSYSKLSSSGNYVVAAGASYVHVSSDAGSTFPDQFNLTPGTILTSVYCSPTDIYYGTMNEGVWKSSISLLLDVPNPANQPFFAAVVTPNAFSEQATLIVDQSLISENSELTITNVNGQLVRKMKITQVSTILNADGLSSGSYFYQVTGSRNQSKFGKFIILD